MWTIRNKQGRQVAIAHSIEYNGEWLGECSVTVSIESPTPIALQVGDWLEYRGERFEINYDPGKIKAAPRNASGNAFQYNDIKFNSLADELSRCDFLDVVLADNNIHFTGLPKFSFYASTVKELADRIQANLDRAYGMGTWTVEVHPEYAEKQDLNITVDTITTWDALALSVSDFKAYFTIRGRHIVIGTTGIPAAHVFRYGKGNGLYEIEQTADSSQKIVTRLRAYGSTRNLPHRYYNSLTNADGNTAIPNNMAVQYLMLPSFPYETQDPYIDSPNLAAIGIREGTIFFDGSTDELEEIYPTIEGMTAEELKAAGITINATGRLDELFTAEIIDDDGVGVVDGNSVEPEKKTFSVVIKDLGFDINHHLTSETATISFKSGMLSGRDFEIVSCRKVANRNVLELNRVYDNDLQLWFPYNSYNAKSGDRFVLLQIEMPDVYIKAASVRLENAAKEWLAKNDYSRSVYNPKVDEIFMARQHDAAVASNGTIASLHDTLKEGMQMLFEDDDLKIDAAIIIDKLVINEGDGAIPTYEVTLKEEKTVGSLQRLQNQIDSLARGFGQGNSGYNSSQIRSLIEAYGALMFLSKRTNDRSAGAIASDIAFEVGNFASGVSGAIMRQRADGQTELEVDRLWIRVKALFEELVAVRTASLAGEQLVTPAGSIKCTSVESVENGWRCYFLAEQDGEKIDNLFKAGDLARCNYFNASTASGNKIHNKFYWRLVTAVGDNYIELSKTECASASDAPEAGDVICQLGNKNASDSERQNAIRISTVLGDVPSIILFSRINDFTLEEKDAVAIGVDATTGRPYIRAYGDVHFGNRNSSGDSIFDYDSANGEMNYRGNLHISSHINGTNKTLGEIADRVVGGGNALLNARFDREDGEGGLLYWQKSGFAKLDRENTLDGVASVQIDVQGTEIEGWRGITQGGVIQNNPSLNVNGRKWVTASVWAMTDDPEAFDNGAQLEVNFCNEEGTRLPGSMAINIVPKHAGVWERFEITAPTEVATNPYAATFFAYVVQNGRLWLAKPQLEWGNVATEWVPNPLDRSYLEEAIEEASADSTDIKGGLVLTTALMTGQTNANGKREIKAGINGVASDGKALALWAGGEMIDAAEEPDNPARALFGMRHDGTGYAADNTIRFKEHEVQVGDDVVLDKDGLTLFDGDSDSEERNARLTIANTAIPQELETAANVNTQSIKTPATASMLLVHVPGFTNPNTGMSTQGYYALLGTAADGSAYSKTYGIADRLTAGATISGTIKLSFDAKLPTNSSGQISQSLNATARVRVMRESWVIGGEPVVVKEVTARFLTTTVGTTHRHTATLTLSSNIVIPGTHSIIVDIPLPSVLGGASSQSVSMTLTPSVTVAMGVVKQTMLGNNGFASIWPKSAQLQQEGMWGVLVGSFGFRIRDGVGFEITTDGGNSWDHTIQIVKKS